MFDVRRSTFDVRRSTFDVRRSTFDVRSLDNAVSPKAETKGGVRGGREPPRYELPRFARTSLRSAAALSNERTSRRRCLISVRRDGVV